MPSLPWYLPCGTESPQTSWALTFLDFHKGQDVLLGTKPGGETSSVGGFVVWSLWIDIQYLGLIITYYFLSFYLLHYAVLTLLLAVCPESPP